MSRLPDDTFPLGAISVELNRVFASVHMSEHVSSTPAIPPGRAWSSNERERAPRTVRPHHRWGQSRPTFAAERTPNQSVSSAQWDTFEEVVDTEDDDNDGSDTIDPGDLQEYDAPIPGVDNSQLETACLKLAELPEALAIVQAARRGASNSNRHSRASPGVKGTSRQPFGRQRVPNSARDQRQSDDRPAQVVGRTQRPRPQPQQRRGTDLQAKLDKRKARSVCHACGQTGHWAGDPLCPGRLVNVIELEDDVQEFEPNQDAGTRQILSVQVDVSDVRFLRPSTRLVLAVNSMAVGRREGARGVIDTAARYTVAGRAWDRAYRQICADRGIGHLINVTPESEVYRFGNGGLLTSTERVTVPVVLADHPLLLSYSVVESPVLSLLNGRDVVEGLGLDIKGSNKTLEYNGGSQPLDDSVAGHYCVTLSPERCETRKFTLSANQSIASTSLVTCFEE